MIKDINIVPKWVVFTADLMVCYFSFLFCHFIKNNLSFRAVDLHTLSGNIIVLLLAFSACFYVFKTYEGIIRYTGVQDVLKIISSVLSVTALLFSEPVEHFFGGAVYFSVIILVLNLFFSILFLISYRFIVKVAFAYLQSNKLDKKNVIIYGAGDAGFATKRVLEHDYSSNINIVAFMDDDQRKIGKVVDGIKIHPTKDLEEIALAQSVEEIIIADFNLAPARKNEIVDFSLDNTIKVLNIPPLDKWINGEFSSKQLQSIKIENLLEREPIKLSNGELYTQINGRRILVTGAAGSIGSEIVRQLLKYSPELIVLCDQAETPLHHLELELLESGKSVTKCYPFLCDITNMERMKELFRKFKPDYVYHAAAYKHVPMMEISATEAILNNTMGTKIVADLSLEFGVKRFVMVSTDKAVNPTNVMGASKRLAEMYVQWMHSKHHSPEHREHEIRFIITRFGNVLGTNGSVVSIFQEQIEKGGPVTVTHPEITRYFMTIPESCQLVLEAGSMGKGGEIFVFDMGEPVAIVDLAKEDDKIVWSDAGNGYPDQVFRITAREKLYEELWMDNEELLPTHHEKITIASTAAENMEDGQQVFDQLLTLAKKNSSEMEIVAKMKELLPEFISNNSIFEKLD